MNNSNFKTLLFFKAALIFLFSCSIESRTSFVGDLDSNIDSISKFQIKQKSKFVFNNDTNDNYWPIFNFNYSKLNTDLYCLSSKWNILSYNFDSSKIFKIKLPSQIKEKLNKDEVHLKMIRYNDSILYFITGKNLIEYHSKSQKIITSEIKFPEYSNSKFSISNMDVQRFGFPVVIDSLMNIQVSSFLLDKKTRLWNKSNDPYPMELSINTKTLTSQYNSIQTPIFFKKFNYGLFEICYRLVNDKKRIFSFPLSGNIYIKQPDGSLLVIGGKSKYQKDSIISPLSYYNEESHVNSDSNWYHYTHNDYYGYLIYNPTIKKYFRFYHHKLPKQLKNGFYATSNDRQVSVQVFSENFKLTHEEVLDGIHYTYYLIPYKNGFIINNNGLRWKSLTHEFFYYEFLKLQIK
jgi:hypothetical protein